jgi:transposase
MRNGKWSTEEKQKIILAGLRNEASVAELCRNYGISDALYYKWKKAFLEGSLNGLRGNGKAGSSETILKKENEELKAMIGELTVENRFLKKIQGS